MSSQIKNCMKNILKTTFNSTEGKTKNQFGCKIMEAGLGKRFGCVIMASGLGKRFGENKLMKDFGGKPMIQWILDATEDLFEQRVVVTRNADVERLCIEQGITVILHEYPGRNDTVRIGVTELSENIEGCMFCVADQPLLTRATVERIVECAGNDKESIWRTACGENVGSPMMFPRKYFNELLNLPEGKGGNYVAKKHSDSVKTVEVLDRYEMMDIDTKEDYEEALKYLGELRRKE